MSKEPIFRTPNTIIASRRVDVIKRRLDEFVEYVQNEDHPRTDDYYSDADSNFGVLDALHAASLLLPSKETPHPKWP